jgi:hypothetical protein
MRPDLSAIVACLVLHATAFWETPQFSKKSRPELRDQTSYIETAGVRHTIFEHKATGANLDFVTNSGISETTPGVNQYSGYFSVGSKLNFLSLENCAILSNFGIQRISATFSGSSKPDTIRNMLHWQHGSMVVQVAHP